RRDMLRWAIGESLTPEMSGAVHTHAEVHPLAVWGPGCRLASSIRAHRSAFGIPGEGHHPARLERPCAIHFDDEHPPAIRREMRVVRHRARFGREVDAPLVLPIF